MSDTSRQVPSLEDEGIPDLEDPVNEDEGMIPPRDHPVAADEFGVTAVEELADEPIAERVTREIPDVSADDIDLDDAERRDLGDRPGRLVQPGDEDVDAVDDEKDVVAMLDEDDPDGLSAEEAAMHITDEP